VLELSNEKAFSTALKKYADHVKQLPRIIAKKIIIDINQKALDFSRVDTGRYVGGWFVSVGSSPSFGVNAYDDGKDRKPIEEQIKREQQSKNDKTALEFKGGTIFLANNVEYAIFREFGTPTQSPDYTLTRAIQVTIERLNTLIKELEFKG
jgi:hypothetical protein